MVPQVARRIGGPGDVARASRCLVRKRP
jgi:hypothetical protein